MGTGNPRRLRSVWIVALSVAVSGGRAAALSSVNQFCTGDPCVISSPKDVDPGATLDFGTRTVVLQSTLNLLPLPSGAIGSVTIHAGNFSITGSSGQIAGFSSTLDGGSVEIDADNNIQITGTTGGGAVRLYGQDAGSLTLNTTNGAVTVSSRLTMYGNGTYAAGGLLTINSATAISLTGQLDFYGGSQGCGGDLELTASDDVTLAGSTLDLSGGGDGGCLDVLTDGSLTLGSVDLSGTGLDASGGLSEIDVGGTVQFLGPFRGRGADAGSDCGDGADVDVCADGNITVGADVDMRGRGLDCSGGCLSLDGDSVYLPSDIMLSGTGSEGNGGELDVYASTLISFTGSVELDGGDGGGGVAYFSSLRAAQILGTMDASGRAATSPGSTQVEFDATTLNVGGSINASGGSSSVDGGQIVLSACDVTTQPTAVLEALGNLGAINVEASRSAKLRGHFTAGSGGNIVRYAPAATPPDTTGATFSPPVTRIVDNTVPPCPVCISNADCSDGNPCTDDVCNNGASCVHSPVNSGACDDGNHCTTNDMCVAGVCVGGPPPVCNDNNPCTSDSCSPGLGCVFSPTAGTCDDGDSCTTGDACSGGLCVGTPINCSDGNPCTDDTCSAGVCAHTNNHAPCGSGNPCTSQDTCSNGACVAGPPLDCNDNDICTTDSCNPTAGCQHASVAGCVDSDHDGKVDGADECTTLAWTSPPTHPPDQDPIKLGVKLTRLAQPNGSQALLIKGFFNVPPSEQLPIDPATNGVHVYAEDAAGPLLSVSLPGGAGCATVDGWSTVGVGFHKTWLYRNRSGALPPACTPNSANGVQLVQIKDRRLSGPHGLQFKVIAKGATLMNQVTAPLTRLQFDLALAAQPTPGVASAQAKAGQCAEALFTGNPISSTTKPSCESKTSNGALTGVSCKGE